MRVANEINFKHNYMACGMASAWTVVDRMIRESIYVLLHKTLGDQRHISSVIWEQMQSKVIDLATERRSINFFFFTLKCNEYVLNERYSLFTYSITLMKNK